ncbi:DUF3857 domain-containing protein [Sediminicola luteus]|uniref:Transglutaminase-like domain-containing protein n=1 Tax=Sediminicola luteus TaxID=319238 RepID=A0A2A4G311_9FLAO|nr:DUF3857 domain-containing protein [Sediminicola luteus]PCE63359.1 hypothetical protein B7P33_14160 [Sediminicola luteus]
MRFLTLLLFCSLTTMGLRAQEVKFGKVSKEELEQKFYPQDSTADAAVLYRRVRVSYKTSPGGGFIQETFIHEKIKLYNKDGFDFATITEGLFEISGEEETAYGFKAYTYNLVDGKVEKTKLKNSELISEKKNKNWQVKKFTMPNLQEGSIIEYQYTIGSPFTWLIDEIDLQYNIPIQKEEVQLAIPEYYVFKPLMKGYLPINPKASRDSKQMQLSYRRNADAGGVKTERVVTNITVNMNVVDIKMQDVPALKEEPFVNSMDNYRSAINYELQYTKFPNSAIENYTTTWKDIVKDIYDASSFGDQLDRKRYFKDDLATILGGLNTETEKTLAVFNHVQKNMTWNGTYGYYTDEGVKKAYETKSGNVADINLTMVAMLRAAGLNSDPVLVSTRNNGIPLFPTKEGFDYVVATVEADGKQLLLDATSKYTKPNMLPVRTINWAGRIVKEGGVSEPISMIPSYVSREIIMMNGTLDGEGVIEGKIRRICKDYVGYGFRVNNNELDEETYLGNLEEKYKGVEIENYEVRDKTDKNKPVTEVFEVLAEESVELIGDKMYFSPLLWFANEENVFKRDQREYPIDFGYPWQDKHVMSITIPEGYQIESIPEAINISLPENMGKFTMRVVPKGNKSIQVLSELGFNEAVIPAMEYPHIKEFYKKVVEKQTEKVVLSKI